MLWPYQITGAAYAFVLIDFDKFPGGIALDLLPEMMHLHFKAADQLFLLGADSAIGCHTQFRSGFTLCIMNLRRRYHYHSAAILILLYCIMQTLFLLRPAFGPAICFSCRLNLFGI